MIFEEKSLREFWELRNGSVVNAGEKPCSELPKFSPEITEPYTNCKECGIPIHLNRQLKNGQSFLCMFCFSHTEAGAEILKVRPVTSKEYPKCSDCGYFQHDEICFNCGGLVVRRDTKEKTKCKVK